MNETQARKDLVEVCRLAYARGYVCGLEGNFSIRLADNLLLSTASATCKGRIEASDLLVTDMDGRLQNCPPGVKLKPSTELAMHLTAYRARADVGAIAHAHPTVAVAFTVAGLPLSSCVLPEVVSMLGVVPTAPYATPGTDEVSASIAELIKQYDAILLDHHGALTCGATIWDAFYKLETIEHYARTMLVASLLGGAKPLYASQVRKLLDTRAAYGFTNVLPVETLTGPQCCMSDPEAAS